jgi:hypothetical protein
MDKFKAASSRLVSMFPNKSDAEVEYDKFICGVLDAARWSPTTPKGTRIPWRFAAEARNHPDFNESFASAGLYIFGGGKGRGTPLYLGMTSKDLWGRLGRRYVRGARSQCQLANDYCNELVEHGIDGFPQDVRSWYRKSHGSNTARLNGAVVFARAGVETIWFTLIPISDASSVRAIEAFLIPIAAAWNRKRNYPPLLNTQDI